MVVACSGCLHQQLCGGEFAALHTLPQRWRGTPCTGAGGQRASGRSVQRFACMVRQLGWRECARRAGVCNGSGTHPTGHAACIV
jgi:hypothetical protein